MKYILFAFLVISSVFAKAQFGFMMAPKEFSSNLNKIVLDFRHNYKNIKGEPIAPNEFNSTVVLPETKDTRIVYPQDTKDTTATWQTVVYTGTDFKEAVKAYKKMCKNVKGAGLQWIDRSDASFAGETIDPEPNKSVTTSMLRLGVMDTRYYKFVALVNLLKEKDGYVVSLVLQNRR